MVAVGAQWQAAPEEVGLVLLMRETQGQGGVFGQVGLGDGIEQTVIFLHVIAEVVGVTV
ncbi:hypothetical protein D3C71_2130110 [compost metagenome]